jgi:hypothetical protein
VARGMNSYTAYNNFSPFVKIFMGFAGSKLPADALNTFQQLNLEVFSKAEVHHDRITSISEYHYSNDGNNLWNNKIFRR